ncbi:guanosine 5'-monophosphate oxidoreductase [Erwinia sp. Ejp617]|nr:guanosine 5'-monophosphate oxidoreductase [Erwinia sp. Ejp617]
MLCASKKIGKPGFKDVLIRPKRSTLQSRSQVELERQFTFKNSGIAWSGVPIIVANMDTVGTFGMAEALSSFDLLTAVYKYYSVEQWRAFVERVSPAVLRHMMVSTGTSEADFTRLQPILALSPMLNFICIDVANGYSEHFVAFLQRAREVCPDKTICAGNVVTGEMVSAIHNFLRLLSVLMRRMALAVRLSAMAAARFLAMWRSFRRRRPFRHVGRYAGPPW